MRTLLSDLLVILPTDSSDLDVALLPSLDHLFRISF